MSSSNGTPPVEATPTPGPSSATPIASIETPASSPAPEESSSPPASPPPSTPSAPETPQPAPSATETLEPAGPIATTIVVTPSAPPGTPAQGTTITITSTSSQLSSVVTPTPTPTSSQSTSSSTTAALATSSPAAAKSSGLSTSSKIAVAVVVPVAGVALILILLLFFWRKRKQRKEAEELRRKEAEEYGFNPNNDPTLPAVAGAGNNREEPFEMSQDSTGGYRGWGATPSAARKPSGTMTSGNGPIGMALSDGGSPPGTHGPGASPSQLPTSEAQSGDPLLNSPERGEFEAVGALGAGPPAGGNRDIRRGPSNASSSYSAGGQSDASGEAPLPAGAQNTNYYPSELEDSSYPHPGPYGGEGAYAGGQPVIRDVQARRNTRIESPSVVPQQGNAGISQNF
ncbi:MAG: hypothetical protein M1825_006036 [Sarcosagium campestre]|nr:MAG: hypothetical protein M1825_006036 [Sarcosagium campestre]